MKPHLVRALFLSMSLLASTVWAEDQRFDVNVPAGDLAGAVDTLARQTKLQVLYDPKLLDGKTTPGLQGRYTAREALEKLVEGSGISFHFTAADAAALSSSGAVGEGTKPTELPEVKVTAPPESGYSVPNATTATKMDVPIRDIPQSIEVRNRQLLDDLGGTHNVYDVGKTVAGVVDVAHGSAAPGINVPGFNIRGYSSSYLRDGGLRVNGWIYTMDMASIDHVEFLKGPASVLYGSTGQSGNFGGLVNYVSKLPQPTAATDAEAVVGSYNYYRGSIDINRPLNADESVLFRINGAFTDAGSFVDEAHTRTWLIAPAFSFQLTPNDRLTLLTEYVQSQATPIEGLPLTTESFNVPYDRNYVDPNFAHIDIYGTSLFLNYQHRFNDDWHLAVDTSIGYGKDQDYENGLYFDSGGTDTWHLSGSHWEFWDTSVSIDPRLDGKFTSGPLAHHLLLGFNWQLDYYRTTGTFGPDLDMGGGTLVDLLPPPNGAYQSVWNGGPLATGKFHNDGQYLAPYIQDLVSIGEHVKILAGVRYDNIYTKAGVSGIFASGVPQFDQFDQHFTHLSPRGGIVWQPIKPTSVYASYSQGFVPNIGITRNHDQLAPEEGELLELGMKQQFGDKFDANLAIYQITQKNLSVSDPANTPTENYLVLLGETRSHGIELDINGQISDAFRMTAAAAVMKAWIVKGNDSLPAGNRLANAPTTTLNLFGVYAFDGRLQGLELGGGAYYASPAYTDTANTLKMPETIEVDAMAAYRFTKHWRVQVDLKNLADRHNYYGDWNDTVMRTPPFSVFATLKASL